MIKGIAIKLFVKGETVLDEFNREIENGEWVDVENVLVGEPSSEDVINDLNLNGKHLSYVLGIPKGDTHDWVDTLVKLPDPFNATFKTYGYPTAGINDMIPLSWNKKVKVERYEQS